MIDFRMRLPNNNVQHSEVMEILGEILHQVREINTKITTIQTGPERHLERTVERRAERRRSERRHVESLQSLAEQSFFEIDLPAEKKATTLVGPRGFLIRDVITLMLITFRRGRIFQHTSRKSEVLSRMLLNHFYLRLPVAAEYVINHIQFNVIKTCSNFGVGMVRKYSSTYFILRI